MGRRRSAYTARRLFGQLVRLEDDVERHDIYGRRLAYVYLHGRNLEEELFREGDARLLVIEPNHAHAHAMLDEELNARAASRRTLGCPAILDSGVGFFDAGYGSGVRHGWS